MREKKKECQSIGIYSFFFFYYKDIWLSVWFKNKKFKKKQ